MSINRIQKLLFSEYCNFEDMVLVESPFAQTTRDGKGIRQVHLGLTPTKLVLATDVLPPVELTNTKYVPGIDPDIETFELVAVYPVECFNLSVFHRRKRQSLKAHFCNNRILYFELGGFEKRNMFWNLWCERVKFLNPEDPGSSRSETSVATSSSNSTLYLMSSKKVRTEEGIQQLWCSFGFDDVRVPKWSERYLYMGPDFIDRPGDYVPHMNKPTYEEFLVKPKTLSTKQHKPKQSRKKSVIDLQKSSVSINRFGTGIPEGCSSGLFLPVEGPFIKKTLPLLHEHYAPVVFPPDYITLTEEAVRIWEISRDNNPNVYKKQRHKRRYGIMPQPYFLYGLGLWSVTTGEKYSVQMKRIASQVKLLDTADTPELNLSISKRQLVSSISCEALHLDNQLMNHGNGIKTVVKKPAVYFWTPNYWYRPRSSRDNYQDLLDHLKKVRESCHRRKMRKRGGSCYKKGICNMNYLSLLSKGGRRKSRSMNRRCLYASDTDDSDGDDKDMYNTSSLLNFFSVSQDISSEKEIRMWSKEASLEDLRRILRMNVALTAWDFDSTSLACQLTVIECTLFLKVTPIELAVLLWQNTSKNAPNIKAILAFAQRISCLVATEVLRDDSDKIRARLISRLINTAEKCHKLSNFQSCRSVLCGLQSPAVYRLHNTWLYVRKCHATKYETFESLCRLYRDPSLPAYRQEFRKASQEYPYLPCLGDLIFRLLDRGGTNVDDYRTLCLLPESSMSNESATKSRFRFTVVKKILSTLHLMPLDNVSVKTENSIAVYQFYDEKITRLNRAIEFLNQSQEAAKMYQFRSNELVSEYLLKARYKEDSENFIHSFNIERISYSKYI